MKMKHSRHPFLRLLIAILVVSTFVLGLTLFNSVYLKNSNFKSFDIGSFDMITGMAVSGFDEITEELPGANPNEARLNPKIATIIIDTLDKDDEGNVNTYPFTMDVYAYPYVTGSRNPVKFDNYKIRLRVFSAQLGVLTAKNNLAGEWTTQFTASNPIPGYMDYIFQATGKNGATYDMTSTNLAEFTFKPKYPGLEASAQIVIVEIDVNHPLIGPSPFDDYFGSQIYIKNRYYLDKDNDDFGDSNSPIEIGEGESVPNNYAYADDNTDCDDNTNDDPDSCPTVVNGGCYGFAGIPITKYLDNKNCAICRNPGMTMDNDNDGVDTDCDGLDGGTTACENSGTCDVEICNNNHDDDDDTKVDGDDSDCLGQKGTCSSGKVYVWTFTDKDIGGFSVPTNNGCARLNYCIYGESSYLLGTVLSTDASLICTGHDYLTEWKKCNAANEGIALFSKECENGKWVDLSEGEVVVQDDDHDSPVTEEQYKLLTPGCGLDVDGDGFLCDYSENYYTCEYDCKKSKICDPDEIIWNNGQNVYGSLDYCLVEDSVCTQNGLACSGVDTDGDLLSDAYETYLESKIPTEVTSLQDYVTWFDNSISDSDKDGINDDWDVCPGTYTLDGVLTLSTGKINAFGCYSSDVSRQVEKDVRPDGCFSFYDTTFYLSYYTNLMGGKSCSYQYNK
ncbi:hypothetical protein HOC35_02635 [Candidatus Woesearchaeota archaeon]|jgi:hypothetical protein|nr:hypothetical protein [Candidatus Woesearchaeota archaeon]